MNGPFPRRPNVRELIKGEAVELVGGPKDGEIMRCPLASPPPVDHSDSVTEGIYRWMGEFNEEELPVWVWQGYSH